MSGNESARQFPYDPNGPAGTFAAAMNYLTQSGEPQLASLLAKAHHVVMRPGSAKRSMLKLTLHDEDAVVAANARATIEDAFLAVSAFSWELSIVPVPADLARLRDRLNEEAASLGLPAVLDVRPRERPGGGAHFVAVHPLGTDPVHIGAIDDVLFRIGRRQTSWVVHAPVSSSERAGTEPTASPLRPERPLVFVSYSTADEMYREELTSHLAQIRRDLADVFSFRQIPAGADHHKEIATSLARASYAILLVSKDFLSSDYVADVELPVLAAPGRTILPVIVGQCDHEFLSKNVYMPWGLDPLNRLQPAERDEVYTQVAKHLRKALLAHASKDQPEPI
jgi:hypothetical protein